MDRIAQINKVVKEYFELNKLVFTVRAKDLMPNFIQAGIFLKDERSGLPIRNILRQLDRAKQLNKLPNVIVDRKKINTNWYFGRTGKEVLPVVSKTIVQNSITRIPKLPTKRKDSDEHYIIDLCDDLLGVIGSRQHRFDFLRGDAGTMLPVDVYYDSLNLVIEFNEQQHTKSIEHFDKPDKLTVSGVHRGEQRRIYDKLKRTVLQQYNIKVIDIPYSAFNCNTKGKLFRDTTADKAIVRNYLFNLNAK